jgi:hypothetical protein
LIPFPFGLVSELETLQLAIANVSPCEAQVENLLKTQEPSATQTQENRSHIPVSNETEMTMLPDVPFLATDPSSSLSPPQPIVEHQALSQAYLPSGLNDGGNFGWEMLGLGLEEPLPTQDVIDELYAYIVPHISKLVSHALTGIKSISTKSILRYPCYIDRGILQP